MNNKVEKIYNKSAERYGQKFSKPVECLNYFLKLLPSNAKILDVGCGVGVNADHASSMGFNVVGIDSSVKMLELATKRNFRVDYRLCDMRNFKSNQKFDGIIASYSLIHIPKNDIILVFKNLCSMLNVGGILYISIHTGKSDEIFLDIPSIHAKSMFLNIMSVEEIERPLMNEDLKIVYRHERVAKKTK